MLKINPLTAWRLLHDYVDLQKGDWLIQSANGEKRGSARAGRRTAPAQFET